MAGDIGIEERAIVLAPAAESTLAAAMTTIRQVAGGAIQQYGPRVVIGEVPAAAAERIEAEVSGAKVVAVPSSLSSATMVDMDDAGRIGLAAFELRQSAEYARAKAERPLQGSSWDVDPPGPPGPPEGEVEPPGGAMESPARSVLGTSARLT